MKRVILHIERLVLKGFRYEDGNAVGDALREELARQLSSRDAAGQLMSRGYVTRLKVGGVQITSSAKPSQVGAQAARGIAREVKS